jgi:hypothetical protein
MIEIYRRNPYTENCQYVNDSDIAIDLSGYKIIFIVKRENDNSINDDLAIITKEQTIVDGTTGQFIISLNSEDTDIAPMVYNYEIQMSKDNIVNTIDQGKFTIKNTIIKVIK